MSSYLLAEFLDAKESALLREKLAAAGIESIVKRHGLPFSLGVEVNYKVMVERADIEKSQGIFKEFRAGLEKKRAEKKSLLAKQCPECGSNDIAQAEKSSLWRRMRFAGVEMRECKSCGAMWYL